MNKTNKNTSLSDLVKQNLNQSEHTNSSFQPSLKIKKVSGHSLPPKFDTKKTSEIKGTIHVEACKTDTRKKKKK